MICILLCDFCLDPFFEAVPVNELLMAFAVAWADQRVAGSLFLLLLMLLGKANPALVLVTNIFDFLGLVVVGVGADLLGLVLLDFTTSVEAELFDQELA